MMVHIKNLSRFVRSVRTSVASRLNKGRQLCPFVSSTLLSDEPDEASAIHNGSGDSEIASIFTGKVLAPTMAQTIAVAATSESWSRARPAGGVVIPSAMLIDISWSTPYPCAGLAVEPVRSEASLEAQQL